MNNRVVALAALLGALLVIVGCGKSSEADPPKTNLTREEVLKISEEAAKAEGRDVSKYNMTGCHYEYTEKD